MLTASSYLLERQAKQKTSIFWQNTFYYYVAEHVIQLSQAAKYLSASSTSGKPRFFFIIYVLIQFLQASNE